MYEEMGIARYPRTGHPIAPAILSDLLTVPVPSGVLASGHSGVRLCDLGADAWRRWDGSVCDRLARAVVEQVRQQVPKLSSDMRRRRLPSPPLGTGPDDIELTVRTYNCLRRAKLLQDPEKLGDLTIGQVLSIHGMGAASLVDLLTSLEHLGAAVTGPSDSDVDGRDTEEERLKRIEAGVKHLKALINAEASYIHRRAAGLALKLDLLDAACAGRPIRLGDIQPGLLLDESERSDVTLQDELADIRRRLSEISALEDTQKLVEHLPPAVSALRQVGPVLEELASRVHGLQSGVDALAKSRPG